MMQLSVISRLQLAGLAWAVALSTAAAAQDLTLVINPRTGATGIQNVGTAPVDIDGYLLGSTAGALNVPGWTPYPGSGWQGGNSTSVHISEGNLLSMSTIAPGQYVSLGFAYAPFAPAAIGEFEPAVTFDYHVAGGSTVTGDVLFAPANNLVLVVDPSDGSARIENQSNFSVEIDGYLISSPTAGALTSAGWTSFVDDNQAGWAEAAPGARHLAETNLLGSRTFAANGGAADLGFPIDPGLLTDQSDLIFEYHVAGGATKLGYVAFELSAAEPIAGDFNGDGDVDGSDFLAWQRGYPGSLTGADLASWQQNFGWGVPAAPNLQTIPEPGTLALAAACVLVGAGAAARRQITEEVMA